MAEDSNMEQPTSDASTADISHPGDGLTTTTTSNTYNNHDQSQSKASSKKNSKVAVAAKETQRKKSSSGGSRASNVSIQVILLDEEEFACQVDVSDKICDNFELSGAMNSFFLLLHRKTPRATRC